VPWHPPQSRSKSVLPATASAESIARGYSGARTDALNAWMSRNIASIITRGE